MSRKVREARAKAVLILMNKSTVFQNQGLPEIPTEWTKFTGTNDLWKRVDFPADQNTSGCLYQGHSGSVFPPHRHNKSMEHFTILNKGGELEVITEHEIKVVSFPDSVFIPMGEPHAVRFLKDTKILVMWHPLMSEGWEAEFAHDAQIQVTPAP